MGEEEKKNDVNKDDFKGEIDNAANGDGLRAEDERVEEDLSDSVDSDNLDNLDDGTGLGHGDVTENSDAANGDELSTESEMLEEDLFGAEDGDNIDNLNDAEDLDSGDVTENSGTEIDTNIDPVVGQSNVSTGDGTLDDVNGETNEDDLPLSLTDDVNPESDTNEVENGGGVAGAFEDISGDAVKESINIDASEGLNTSNDDSPADDLTDKDPIADKSALEPQAKSGFSIGTLVNVIKGVKEGVFSIKGKDLLKALRNPWVIANGVVLIMALSATVIVVNWFKTKAVTLNDALTDITQLQSEIEKEKKSLKPAKVTVRPFIVDEETLFNEGLRKVVNEQKERDNKFTSLLKSAEESFGENKYQEALVFYNALIEEESGLKDNSFLNLRIGECYFHSGSYDEAVETLEASLESGIRDKENKLRSNYLLAESYIKLGNFEKGRRTLYALMALREEFSPKMTALIDRSYFTIANSYLEEARLGFKITE